jgi:phosphatidylserine/phosphatidylglycerophosphate/cardiolipin synthase-like enzyme
MDPLALPVFAAQDAIVLHDRDYHLWVLHHLNTARVRILATQFIADIRPAADPHRDVLAVAAALARAAARGIDVRVVVSRFASDRDLLEPNRVFGRWLASRGVEVRLYVPHAGSTRRDVHTKCTIIDDEWTVVGSHNWTIGAFGANHEQSVAVRSRDVALRLRSTFEGIWQSAEPAASAAAAPVPAAPVERP